MPNTSLAMSTHLRAEVGPSGAGFAEVDVRRDAAAQACDQIVVHAFVVVGMYRHTTRPAERVAKPLLQQVQVSLLNHEHQLRPAEVASRHADASALLA